MPGNFYSTSCKGIGGQIKRRYTDFVVEEILENGKICEAKRFTVNGSQQEERLSVPKKQGEKDQLLLDLEKINKDTNFVIRTVSRFLQCSKKRIGYAGLKDKRAVTCQRISLFKPNLERLALFESRGIQLRNPKWSNKRIELGMLAGNRFTVTIRDIELPEKELRKRIEDCFKQMRKGIANYFGEQRFGGIRQITHLVGKEFVNEDFKKGVLLYLTHSVEGEEEEIKNARQKLAETGDFKEASKLFPLKFRYERAMIHHLCKYPKDFVGAFSKLPKQLRYLFTHAYQSFLFNRVIEQRFKEGIGLKSVKGDILTGDKPSGPLFGFESKLATGKPGEIEGKILEEESLKLEDFKVKKMAEISSKGTRKSIVLLPEKMRLVSVEEDEFFPGKRAAAISFELSKGNYATTVLRELMKSDIK
jgi:tRNA pseudouridine13 synthase